MAESATVQELRAAQTISVNEVEAAVSAILSSPEIRAFPIGGGFVLDLAGAIAASRVATMILKDVHANDRHRRNAVRTAILLARPDKQ